jgi:hypothetical protein
MKVWNTFSSMGGGKELTVMFMITMCIWGREKMFYFLAAWSFHTVLIGIGKLVYHQPRPYMMLDKITPVHCSKAFGNPSGHSHGINLFCTLVFLDLFHGVPVKLLRDPSVKKIWTHGWPIYIITAILFIGLQICMPLSRYILGVHSLD